MCREIWLPPSWLGEATPESIASAVEPFLDPTSPVRARAVASLGRVRSRLAPPDGRGVAEHVVDLAAQVMGYA